MPLELIAGAFIIAFGAIVVLGHVLVAAAIYKCLREDYAGGRSRRTTSAMTTADDGIKSVTHAANLCETLKPQQARALSVRRVLRSGRPREGGDPGLQTAAPGFPLARE
jgi:hypothetical protein